MVVKPNSKRADVENCGSIKMKLFFPPQGTIEGYLGFKAGQARPHWGTGKSSWQTFLIERKAAISRNELSIAIGSTQVPKM